MSWKRLFAGFLVFLSCFSVYALDLSEDDSGRVDVCLGACDLGCVWGVYGGVSYSLEDVSGGDLAVFWRGAGDIFLDSSCAGSFDYAAQSYLTSASYLESSGGDHLFYRDVSQGFVDRMDGCSDSECLGLACKYAGLFGLLSGDGECAGTYFGRSLSYLEDFYDYVPAYLLADLRIHTYEDEGLEVVRDKFFPGDEVYIYSDLFMEGVSIGSWFTGRVVDPLGDEFLLDFEEGFSSFVPEKKGVYVITVRGGREGLPAFESEKKVYVLTRNCNLDNVCDENDGEDRFTCPQDCSLPEETEGRTTTTYTAEKSAPSEEGRVDGMRGSGIVTYAVVLFLLFIFLCLVYRRRKRGG